MTALRSLVAPFGIYIKQAPAAPDGLTNFSKQTAIDKSSLAI